MHAMSEFWTAQLAFLAFIFVAVCALGVILLEVIFSTVVQAYAKRGAPPPRREVTPARRPSRR